MMKPADWDCVFVAHLSAERAGLSKANVMRFGRRAAANNAGLRGDELAVLLIAQANGFRCNATAPGASVIRQNSRRDPTASSTVVANGFSTEGQDLLRRRMQSFLTNGRTPPRSLRAFHGNLPRQLGVGGDQHVLGRKVLVNPICGIVGGLEVGNVGEQLFPKRS